MESMPCLQQFPGCDLDFLQPGFDLLLEVRQSNPVQFDPKLEPLDPRAGGVYFALEPSRRGLVRICPLAQPLLESLDPFASPLQNLVQVRLGGHQRRFRHGQDRLSTQGLPRGLSVLRQAAYETDMVVQDAQLFQPNSWLEQID